MLQTHFELNKVWLRTNATTESLVGHDVKDATAISVWEELRSQLQEGGKRAYY